MKSPFVAAPVVVRTLVVVVGVLLALLGGVGVTGASDALLSGLRPPTDLRFSDVSESTAGPDRELTLIASIDARVIVTQTITLDGSDPLLSEDTIDLLRENPSYLDFAFGKLELSTENGYVALTPTPFTVTRAGSDPATIELQYVSALLRTGDGPYLLKYSTPPETPSRLLVTASESWSIITARPSRLVDSQSATSVSTITVAGTNYRVSSVPTSMEIGFIASSTSITGELAPTSIAGNWVDRYLGSSLWIALIWIIFIGVLQRRRRPDVWDEPHTPAPWTRLGPLVGALTLFTALGFLPVFFVSVLKPLILPLFDRGIESTLNTFLIAAGNPPTAVISIVVAWAWSLHFDHRAASDRRPRAALLVALSTVAAVGVGLSWLLGAAPAIDMRYDAEIVEGAGLVGVVAIVAGAVLVILGFGGRLSLFGGLAAGAVSTAFIALTSILGDWRADIAGHVIVVAVLAATLCALAAAVMRVISTSPGTKRWVILGVAGLAIATTGPRVGRPNELLALNDVWDLNDLFVDAIRIALAVLLVVGLARAGRELGTWTRHGLFFVGVLLLFRPTTFVGIPLSMLLGASLLSLLLLQRDADSRWHAPADKAIGSEVRSFVKAIGLRRMDSDYWSAVRRSIASGSVPAVELEATKAKIAKVQFVGEPVTSGAMGWGGTPAAALRRGGFGAVIATLAGMPFALDPVGYLLGLADDASGPSVLARTLDTVIGLGFPIYGFAFGFLFPVLRGNRGITKGLLMAGALVLTESVVILIPFEWSAALQQVLLLRVLQIVTVFVCVGFAFDVRSLRSAGLSLDRIGDIYSVNRFVVWSSGLVVAAGAALGTALLSSATDTLLMLVTGASK